MFCYIYMLLHLSTSGLICVWMYVLVDLYVLGLRFSWIYSCQTRKPGGHKAKVCIINRFHALLHISLLLVTRSLARGRSPTAHNLWHVTMAISFFYFFSRYSSTFHQMFDGLSYEIFSRCSVTATRTRQLTTKRF